MLKNKYFLNYLRWITRGEIPDKVLKKSFDLKFEIRGGKPSITFKIKENVKTEDWHWYYGTVK